ncbi:unnamed protein product [Protopolystoma xenopodis]|uniref:G domain-containing protein n=1 Tax=Protopolystoma xenopodis TaxID=117903 RepID=A0A3S5FHA5_9PLAT|nr:unnamed protein product [Protopolystoma xenopodis]
MVRTPDLNDNNLNSDPESTSDLSESQTTIISEDERDSNAEAVYADEGEDDYGTNDAEAIDETKSHLVDFYPHNKMKSGALDQRQHGFEAKHHKLEQKELVRDGKKYFTIGFVGYPNVGKSSTLNALFGSKKTSVSFTPGKTKHFQVTITLMKCNHPSSP